MYARSATIGIIAGIAIALPGLVPGFTLQSTGAVDLRAAGHEAQYGVVPAAVHGKPILVVALGGSSDRGAIQLSHLGSQLPEPGRYPIRSSWDEAGSDTDSFHASFMAGSAEHPRGWFHGESGWVTITKSREGRISGAFEVRARGFMGNDSANEDRWVTVRGSFDADDSMVATIASAQ